MHAGPVVLAYHRQREASFVARVARSPRGPLGRDGGTIERQLLRDHPAEREAEHVAA